jgi:hypothetical protein
MIPSSIHDDWRTESSRRYGFLLFTTVLSAEIEVQPFQGDLANVDHRGDLASFSTSIGSSRTART